MKQTYYWLAATVATGIILMGQVASYTPFILQGAKLFVGFILLLVLVYLGTLFLFKAKKNYLTRADCKAALIPPGIVAVVMILLVYIGFAIG